LIKIRWSGRRIGNEEGGETRCKRGTPSGPLINKRLEVFTYFAFLFRIS